MSNFRYLLIMRHAKSSHGRADLSDHDRPLKKRGEDAAARIGRWLRAQSFVPDTIASSTALRAKNTATYVAEACGAQNPPILLPELYLAGPNVYLEWAVSLDANVHCAMAVGHNPGVEEFIEGLTGQPVVMPTAAVGVMQIKSETWEDFASNPKAELEALWTPETLPEDFE